MTLTDVLPTVRQLSAQDKLKLIRILAEELDTKVDAFPFQPNRIYYLATPYNSFGAGRKLMDSIKPDDNRKN